MVKRTENNKLDFSFKRS